jgi:hypothetical protein
MKRRKTYNPPQKLAGIAVLCFAFILTISLVFPLNAGGADFVCPKQTTIPAMKNSSQIQIGEEVLEIYETAHPYAGTGRIWEKTFHWPNASYIKIHFADFDLATGDYVEVSSPDGTYTYRYTGKGKVVRGGAAVLSTFWATYIPGDTAVVRLYATNAEGAYGFTIDKWARGYEPEAVDQLFDIDQEAICGSDDKRWAPCYTGTIYQKSKTVTRLHIGGTGACTGWLLGSEGHIMTNNHCIATQSGADNTDYEFMGEGATCTTNCSGWMSCPGTIEASSGTLVKTDWSLDYSLILLPTNVTSKYGYLQFRNALPSLDERIYIPQHPGAKGKQIAVDSDTDGPLCKIYSTNEPACFGGPGDIGYYCDTEGGSSGSPVLGYADNLVVALHHCANCPNRGVPIPSIISDLGSALPNNAIGGSADPVPDIKANGSDGPISVASGANVSLVVTLNAGAAAGTNGDWWVLCDSPFGWYYDDLVSGWQPGTSVTYQGPLSDLPPYEVLNSPLPDGAYTCYFGVDMVMNGALDLGQLYYDSVDFNVSPSTCGGWLWNGACWYTSAAVGMTCNQVCADKGGFDAAGSQHTGNDVGKHFWPGKADGYDWVSVECSSTDNNTNWGANGQWPDGNWTHPYCYVNCACNQ